jgi:hypothetical protein
MRRMSALNDRIEPAALIVMATFAVYLCLPAARLSSENIALVRHGVMVDPAICESVGKNASWQEFKTGYFDLYVEQGVDLNTVERNLRKRLFLANRTGGRGAGREDEIARRLDDICERAMDILDLHPGMGRRGVRIFKNSEDLNTAYVTLTGKAGSVRAFYSHDCGVIFTSENEITDSVMAHEIAHAIVDSHYKGVPQPKVGEMLASYVDMHISD